MNHATTIATPSRAMAITAARQERGAAERRPPIIKSGIAGL
jgi:hypothetical protein